MGASDISLSAAFSQTYATRVKGVSAEVTQAESFISTVEAQMKSGGSIAAQTAQDAHSMAQRLDMVGSALALEGLNSNASADELQTNLARIERTTDRLNKIIGGFGK